MQLVRRTRTHFVIGSLLIVSGCTAALWMASSRAREAARESDCRSHLKQLGLALVNYHETYGSFPPAYVLSHDGRPAHSWRVLILPFWDRNELYEQYDFSARWNEPQNEAVAAYRTQSFFFGCPSGNSQSSGTTNYVAVIGPDTAWPGESSTSLNAFTDDPASTILILELPDSSRPWLKPEDITLQSLLSSGLSSNHPTHVNALFADLRVRRLRADVSPETLNALLTVSGGEQTAIEHWQVDRHH